MQWVNFICFKNNKTFKGYQRIISHGLPKFRFKICGLILDTRFEFDILCRQMECKSTSLLLEFFQVSNSHWHELVQPIIFGHLAVVHPELHFLQSSRSYRVPNRSHFQQGSRQYLIFVMILFDQIRRLTDIVFIRAWMKKDPLSLPQIHFVHVLRRDRGHRLFLRMELLLTGSSDLHNMHGQHKESNPLDLDLYQQLRHLLALQSVRSMGSILLWIELVLFICNWMFLCYIETYILVSLYHWLESLGRMSRMRSKLKRASF